MLLSQRIIPALAGNTHCNSSYICPYGDHPRTRGEHVSVSTSMSPSPGSSPHSRGTLRPCAIGAERTRIIPALAGNTFTNGNFDSGSKDHPRTRGEHIHRSPSGIAGIGSSPHSRGTPYGDVIRPGWQKDHPRTRGEHKSLDL